jgi:hypothetical protein
VFSIERLKAILNTTPLVTYSGYSYRVIEDRWRNDPLAEGEAADEHGNSRHNAVEEIECANGSDTDEIEQRALDAKVCEGLVQALKDLVPPTGCGVCLHRKPLTFANVDGWVARWRLWSTIRFPTAS